MVSAMKAAGKEMKTFMKVAAAGACFRLGWICLLPAAPLLPLRAATPRLLELLSGVGRVASAPRDGRAVVSWAPLGVARKQALVAIMFVSAICCG